MSRQKVCQVRGSVVTGSAVSCGKPIRAVLWSLSGLKFTGGSE